MKKLLFALLFLTAPLGATVIIDSQTASGVQEGLEINTWSMTIGTGINRAVVLGCEINAVPPLGVSSATIGTSTFTRINSTAGSLDRAELWIATGVASGAQTINVYGPPGSGYTGKIFPCGAISFENVNQSSPVDISTGSVNVSSVTFTTTVSTTMLVDVIGQGTVGDAPVPNSGQTLKWKVENQGRSTSQAGSIKDGGAAGSKSMGWTITANNAMAALALKSAPGAPDITTLSPATKGIGTGSFTLTVNGQNFVTGSSVTWNGANRATTFVNSTQLTAVILSTDVLNIGLYPVRVISTDTARSNTVSFNLTGDVTFIWATDGGYKPTQDDLYGTTNISTVTNTRIWDGTTIKPFQAKNELNGFALVLENNTVINSTNVSVSYPVLTGPNSYVLSSTRPAAANLWDYRNRPITMYYVRYLPINGLSTLAYETYDEYHVPERFQATCTPSGNQCVRTGNWTSRPDADKYYPDIMVPMEAVTGSTFTVASSSSQVIWVDVYIPKDAPAGLYTGTINVYEGAQVSTSIPISLTVYPFTMPDTPPSKPYAIISVPHINNRHGLTSYPNYTSLTSSYTVSRLHYYQQLHRFGITPVGDAEQGGCGSLMQSGPCPEFQIQLDGSLYSNSYGYANAPGVLTPEPLYMMFAYGSWRGTSYWPYTYAATCANANIWVQWFQNHAPHAEYFWYLEDEATDFTNNNTWSTWLSTCPAPGNLLVPFATANLEQAITGLPYVKHIATTKPLGVATVEESARKSYATSRTKRLDYYNGYRPFTGSMVTDDDGVAWRVMQWMQYKKKLDHYFIWETTNYESGGAENNLFHNAKTFGYHTSTSAVIGYTGFGYNNGDGVLMYPGTDNVNPADSYGVDVPFPAWRLMMWRRGINDFTYLTLAAKYDPRAVDAIVRRMIPQVLWEYGVEDPLDPTYHYGGKSWTSDPNLWERAREELAQIISAHR